MTGSDAPTRTLGSTLTSPRPDPFSEIQLITLRALQGSNYWSRTPVARMDIQLGAYEDISSAEVPQLTESLIAALPGLEEHHCSIGAPGGFVVRLRRGTYAAHIAEHVALELQMMIGHDAGYGRARGTDTRGEYTVVTEQSHSAVGTRALALALEVVQRAFAGTLSSVHRAVEELTSLAATPDSPRPSMRVSCAVTGSGSRARTCVCERLATMPGHAARDAPIVDLSPAYLLEAGLQYGVSDIASDPRRGLRRDPAVLPCARPCRAAARGSRRRGAARRCRRVRFGRGTHPRAGARRGTNGRDVRPL